MSTPRIALATCNDHPDLTDDDQALVAAFGAAGIVAVPQVWDAQGVDWGAFDAVVLRSTWDYASRRDEFVAWAHSVPQLINGPVVVDWNTDKHYLKELADDGVATIETLWLDPSKHLTSQAIHTRLPAFGDFVIKPTISAGARDTIRYRESSAAARGKAILHARGLLRAGRHVMVQRYFEKVDTVGETCLVFLAGEFSHAVRKEAMLQRDRVPETEGYQREIMSTAEATDAEMDLAVRTLDAAAHRLGVSVTDLTYARIDMLPDDEDVPHLLELELVEPTLFFENDENAAARFVDAISRRLAR